MFAAEPANPDDPGVTITSQGGVTATFYSSTLSQGATQQDGSTAGVFYLYPKSPGCYALQADGTGFEDTVVFVATQT